jgi:hypothetical protein
MVPETIYPGPLLVGQATANYSAPLLTLDTVNLLAGVLGIPVALTPDSGLGQINIGVFDCNDHAAAGVAFTLSNFGPQTVLYYNSGGVPSTHATVTDQTLGGGGAVNVPAGETNVTATLRELSIPLGTIEVTVRSGVIATVYIRVRTAH